MRGSHLVLFAWLEDGGLQRDGGLPAVFDKVSAFLFFFLLKVSFVNISSIFSSKFYIINKLDLRQW